MALKLRFRTNFPQKIFLFLSFFHLSLNERKKIWVGSSFKTFLVSKTKREVSNRWSRSRPWPPTPSSSSSSSLWPTSPPFFNAEGKKFLRFHFFWVEILFAFLTFDFEKKENMINGLDKVRVGVTQCLIFDSPDADCGFEEKEVVETVMSSSFLSLFL